MILQSNDNFLIVKAEVDILTLSLLPFNPAPTSRSDMLNAQFHLPLIKLINIAVKCLSCLKDFIYFSPRNIQ